MGDILITEPVIARLRDTYAHVTIFTDYPDAARLIGAYDEVRPYREHHDIKDGEYDRVIGLVYEIYPGINHLDGYARFAGVSLAHRVPRVQPAPKPILGGPYGLIAPHTSEWIRTMREWSQDKFGDLRERLQSALGYPFIFLEPTYSFGEMVSLIAHCNCFIGNDSGPAILAQSYARPCFVIFGATAPERILLSDTAVGILRDVGCNGCKHFARHTDIECAAPICLEQLPFDEVADQVIGHLRQ
jgi:ADP-heptose:LPS heptosyltransferase